MPFGHYGDVDIAGKGYHIFFWSSLKSDCQREAREKRKDGFLARVIKHPIRMGTLAGGGKYEQWCVAVRGTVAHRPKTGKLSMTVTREQHGKRHGRK
jgi:hypothetical protein